MTPVKNIYKIVAVAFLAVGLAWFFMGVKAADARAQTGSVVVDAGGSGEAGRVAPDASGLVEGCQRVDSHTQKVLFVDGGVHVWGHKNLYKRHRSRWGGDFLSTSFQANNFFSFIPFDYDLFAHRSFSSHLTIPSLRGPPCRC